MVLRSGLIIVLTLMALAAAAVPVNDAKAASRCTRAPLSDIAFGKEATIKQAFGKLDDYAKQIAKDRGWPNDSLVRSREESSCEIYLNLGPFGTEYKCRVTATYCVR